MRPLTRLVRPFRAVRWRRVLLVVVLVWLLLSIILGVAVHARAQVSTAQTADVIIVLGAGLNRNNTPTRPQRERTRHAADIWHRGLAPVVICTGGTPGFATRSEADACREILLAQGVPESAILVEDRSRSTEENALYARELMQANGWDTALLVSDGYHMLRAEWIFSSVGIRTYASPTDASYLSPLRYLYHVAREVAALQFQAVTDLLNLPVTYVPLI